MRHQWFRVLALTALTASRALAAAAAAPPPPLPVPGSPQVHATMLDSVDRILAVPTSFVTDRQKNVHHAPSVEYDTDPADPASKFGTAVKASVVFLPRPAPEDISNGTFHPFGWASIGGWKMYMTWADGDSEYFTGERLFRDIGNKIYGIPLSAKNALVDPTDAGSGTFLEYYAIAITQHIQANKPDDFRTPIADNTITSASLQKVLEEFPWADPRNPCNKLNATTYRKLLKVYLDFIKAHQRGHFATLLLPFTSLPLLPNPAGTPPFRPLMYLNELIQEQSALPTAAKESMLVPPNPFVTPSEGFRTRPPTIRIPPSVTVQKASNGQDTFQFPSDPANWYAFRAQIRYDFQNLPSLVDVEMPPAPKILPQYSLRNPSNPTDLDGPMNFPPVNPSLAGSFGVFTPPRNATIDNRLLSNGYLDGLQRAIPRANAGGKHPLIPYMNDYPVPNPLPFFKKYDGAPFNLSRADIDNLTTDPASSRLAVEHAPLPVAAFDVRHLDLFGPDEMIELAKTNAPPVPARQLRQSAMQIYVTVNYWVQKGSSPDAAVTAPAAGPYRITDDGYCFTNNYVGDLPDNELLRTGTVPPPVPVGLAKKNKELGECNDKGGSVVDGDPYQRSGLPKRDYRITPAAKDPRITVGQRASLDETQAGFPDVREQSPGVARFPGDKAFYEILQKYAGSPVLGNPNSLGDAFVEATIGSGPAFNYVYSASGQPIRANDPRSPVEYWTDARHMAVVWPFKVPSGPANPYTPGVFLTAPETVVGPYALSLDGAARNGYVYARAPFHYPSNSSNKALDQCQPVVLAPRLRAVLNDMYERSLVGEVHMTASVSDRWGREAVAGTGYKYSAGLVLNTATDSLHSIGKLVLRVGTHNGAAEIPFPTSFVPLLPNYPTFEGTLGVPEHPTFVAAYDARIKTSAPGGAQAGIQPLSKATLDQTAQISVVDGCGNIYIKASMTVAAASVARPTASVTILKPGTKSHEDSGVTLGVPIGERNYILGNEGFQQYTPANAVGSLSSRVNNDPRTPAALKSDPIVLDGTLPEFQTVTVPPFETEHIGANGKPVPVTHSGTAVNPGNAFFRPPDGREFVKGHQVILEVAGEAAVPPGRNAFDLDDVVPGRAGYKSKIYAGYVARMTATVFPPNTGGSGAKKTPEIVKNLFVFDSQNGFSTSSAKVPLPPLARFDYVFREATSAKPASLGDPIPAGNYYYLVQIDVEDVAGGFRRIKIPVWIKDEGAEINELSSERKRK